MAKSQYYQYLDRGWQLVPIPAGGKRPTNKGWPDNPITTAEEVDLWADAGYGFGVLLGGSGVVSIDIDDEAAARRLFAAAGLDLDMYKDMSCVVSGNPARWRVMFAAPAGIDLRRVYVRAGDEIDSPVAYELRAGRVQDVLPPTPHPEHGSYRWLRYGDLEPLPAEILDLWVSLSAPAREHTSEYIEDPAICWYNSQYDVEDILVEHGYEQVDKGRYVPPGSTSGIAGVVILPSGKVYSHNASDVLADGKPHSAFDLACKFYYDDNFGIAKRAVQRAYMEATMQDTLTVTPEAPASLEIPLDTPPAPTKDQIKQINALLDVLPRKTVQNKNGGTESVYARDVDSAVMVLDFFGTKLSTNELNRLPYIMTEPVWSDYNKGAVGSTYPRLLSDTDEYAFRRWAEHNLGKTWGRGDCASIYANAIKETVAKNSHNPLGDYLSSLSWDGKPRVAEWLKTYLGAVEDDPAYVSAVGRKWLIGAVARAMDPGCQMDNMLVLEGPQNAGKTSALRILGGKFYTEAFKGLSSKDEKELLVGAWIVNYDELGTLGGAKSDMEHLKYHLTVRTDKYRPSYGRNTVEIPRSCAFAATINPGDLGYLGDDTGNRRFWPVECGDIDLAGLVRDRDQLWAEAVRLYQSGEIWYLTRAEADLAAVKTAQRALHNVWTDGVREYVDGGTYGSPRSEVKLLDVLEAVKADKSAYTQRKVAAALKVLGFEARHTKQGNMWVREGASPTGKPDRAKPQLRMITVDIEDLIN